MSAQNGSRPDLDARMKDPLGRWRSDALALAGLLAAITALFAPALLGWLPGARDLLHFSLPARTLWRTAILAGELPSWNPYVGLGVSPLASPVHGTFYPGNLLLLLGPATWSVPFCWFVHTVVAGVGAYVVARLLGCRPAAALLSGLVWSVGGYAVSMWENGEKVLSMAWMPWAIAGLLRLVRLPRLSSPMLAATALAMALVCLAGDPFLLGHVLLIGLPLAWAVTPGRGAVARATLRTGVALALALLLASAVLLPALSLIGLSERAGGLAGARAELWSLHPIRLLELVAPGALGDPADPALYPGAAYVADAGLGSTPWAFSIYAGAAALLLAGLAGRCRVATALWASAAFALLLALGRYLPVHGVVSVLFAPLRYMRYPEKHVLVTIASLGWLGAMGAERLWRREVPLFRLPIVACVCAALVFVLTPASLRGPVRHGLLHFALAALALAGAFHLSRRRTVLAWLVPTVAACDLIVAAFPLLTWFDGSLLNRPPPMVAAIREGGIGPTPPRLYRPAEAGPRYDTLPHNLGLLFGVAHLLAHESVLPASFHLLWDQLSRSGVRALALLDADWAFLPEGPPPPGMVRVAGDQGWQLVHATQPARARLVHRVEIADDRIALTKLALPQFDPTNQAVLAPGPYAMPLSGVEAADVCTIERHERTSVTVHCVSKAAGLLILAEQFYPGWSATVDGASVPVVRANLVMRGVSVAAGEHRIHFHFAVPGLALAVALSALGLVLCLGLVLAPSVRRRVWS